MNFITFLYNDKEQIGLLNDEDIISISELDLSKKFLDMTDFIKNFSSQDLNKIKNSSKKIKLEDVKLLSPIRNPAHDIICVGKNYMDHIKEMDKNSGKIDIDKFKLNYFSKRAGRILGTGEDIKVRFDLDESVDYESELAVIIGKKCKDISKEEVRQYIFGFSIFNDLSSRRIQKEHKQWFLGKSIDNYSILGPCIVSVDEFNLPLKLKIQSKVNGEIRQDSNTRYMIKSVEDIIVELSKHMTLFPGDIISTGTPSGVGMGFDPPRYLKKCDEVECLIEGIGNLKNQII